MASIVMDVLTSIDERSAALGARKLEETLKASGTVAGEGFAANLKSGILGGIREGDFDSIHGVMSSSSMLAKATTSGSLVGTAFAGGIAVAAAAGIMDAAVKIGESFESINRQITLHTAASGEALEALKSQADALVGSLDTSTKTLGTDMATLAQRLGLLGEENKATLGKLTHDFEMLTDRFGLGAQAVGNFSAAMVQFHVAGADADAVLGSLTNSARDTGTNLNTVIDGLVKVGPTLTDLGLNAEQSGHLFAQTAQILGSPEKAVQSFGMALKDAAKENESLAQFLPRVAAGIKAYQDAGNTAAADAVANDVFGARKAEDAMRIIGELNKTIAAGPTAFGVGGDYLTDLEKSTRTLENDWDRVKNTIASALAPQGLNVVDQVASKMDEFIGWLDAHKQDLANMFTTAIGAIETVLKDITGIVGFLTKLPGLIDAITFGFEAWAAIKGITIVAGALKGIVTTLGLIPPAAATAVTSEEAVGAAGVTAGATASAGLLAIVTRLGSIITIGAIAGKTLDGLSMKIPFIRDRFLSPDGSYKNPIDRWASHIPGLDWLDPDMTGHGSAGAPAVPGAPAEPRAPGGVGGGFEAPKPTTGGWVPGGAPVTIDELDSLGKKPKKGPKGPRLPAEPEIPYEPGYGAAPYPGETAEQYRKAQDLMEKRHGVAEAQARLNQLEHDNNATADDIQKAKNKLLRAEEELNQAQLEGLKKHTTALDEFGVKLDKDFGISKGLAGIADNLVKFVAALAFAPAMGQLGAVAEASGASKQSGRGLIGMAAAGGAFGPSFMPGADGGGGMPSLSYPGNPTSPAEFGAAGNRVGALYAFAESLQGTPYSTQLRNDCSGMVSKLANVALGLPPAVSFDTTSEGAWLQSHGFQSGMGPPGSFQVGWNPQPGMSGHTAATLPGGVNAEQGGSHSAFTLGPGAAGGGSSQFPMHAYLPMGYQGYDSGGAVPIIAHGGEWVIRKDAVDHYGPGFMAAINNRQFDGGGSVDVLHDKGDGNLKTAGPGSGGGKSGGGKEGWDPVGKGWHWLWDQHLAHPDWSALDPSKWHFQGGGPIGHYGQGGDVSDIAPWDMPDPKPAYAGIAPWDPGVGGSTPKQPPASPVPINPTPIGGAAPEHGFGGGLPGGGGGGLAGGGADSAGKTVIGGAAPAMGAGGGASAVGGGVAAGAASGAATMGIGIAAQIAMQEAQRAIQYAGSVAGIGVEGLQQTFLPTGGSKLAQGSWLAKIGGGLAGAQPQLPNMAGKNPSGQPPPPPGPSPEAILGQPMPPKEAGGSPTSIGPAVHIEHYHVEHSEDRAGKDIARHNMHQTDPTPGAR
jgi:hypothetical protein